MPKRLCACGSSIPSMSGSSRCLACRQRESKVTRVCAYEPCSGEFSTTKAKSRFCGVLCWLRFKSEQRQNAGDFIVHSCLSNEHDLYDPTKCRCRLRVSDAEVQESFRSNAIRNLDEAHRHERCWTGGDVVLIGKLQRPPICSLGTRIATEKLACGRTLAADELLRLQAVASEDRQWRSLERIQKVEIEHELSLEAMGSLLVEIPDEKWLKDRDDAEGIPIIQSRVGIDERSSVGVDVGADSEPTNSEELAA